MTIKHIFFGILCFFLTLYSLKAQNYGAEFEVNSEVGCESFTVVVNNLSLAPDTVAIIYDWGDGSPLDSVTSHSYDQAGIYTIVQFVANADPRTDTAIVEVIDHYPPEFTLMACKGQSGLVRVQDTLYEAYEVYWGDGASEIIQANTFYNHNYVIFNNYDVTVKGLINGTQTALDSSNINCSANTKRLNMILDLQEATINEIRVLDTDGSNGRISVDYTLTPDNNYLIEMREQNQTSFTIIDTINRTTNPSNYILSNLNTEDNSYCVSLTAFDPCDGETKQSNIGCSVLIEATAQNQQNQINWNTSSTNFLNYTIQKDGNQIANINNQTQNIYLDNQVTCGMDYQYQVIMQENNGFISISDTSEVTATSTDVPDPIANINATVEGQNILLTWEEPINYLAVGYIISRSTNGEGFAVLDTIQDLSYSDLDLFTQSTNYNYSLRYFDACFNLSAESIVSSPVLLVLEHDNMLSWSEYNGWENGVREYILEKYDENGQLIESVNLGSSTSYQEDPAMNTYQYIMYKIISMPNDFSQEPTASNILEVIYPSKVVFPNAFSPNGDGLNDIFTFESRYIMTFSMSIYNRWGELIFQTSDQDSGWDGTIAGRAAPPGTYIHHTELTDDMGITFVKSGEIVLIR